MRGGCLQIVTMAFLFEGFLGGENEERVRGCVRLMWQPVVADVHVRRRRQVGEETGELHEKKKRGQSQETHPDLEGQVAAVEEHDVAGQGMLAHPTTWPCPVPHPGLLLGSPSLDLPPREEAQHVAHSHPLTLLKTPLLPSPHPSSLSLALSLSGPLLALLLLKTPSFSSLTAALSPTGGRVRLTGAASWTGARQVAGQRSREG